MIVGSSGLLLLKVAFGCSMIAIIARMAIIDCRELILPNRLNLLLAGSGVAQAVLVGQPNLIDAALGAMLGYVLLATVASVFRRVRGIDGLGFGDQKFAAAAGLWIGWEAIAPMLLVASCSALAFVAIRSTYERRFDLVARVPFGPFLGFGTMVCWSITATSGS